MIIAYVSHHLPGRTRLRLPACRGDHDYFSQLTQWVSEAPGVTAVSANPGLGSLLVQHRVPFSEVSRYAAGQGWFQLESPPTPTVLSQQLVRHASAAQHTADRILAPGGDVRGLIAMGLMSLGFAQLVKGQVLPPALTLLWYGFSLVAAAR